MNKYSTKCWWFSSETGRCMHKDNSQSPFKAWCGYKEHNGDYKQNTLSKKECEKYKPMKADLK